MKIWTILGGGVLLVAGSQVIGSGSWIIPDAVSPKLVESVLKELGFALIIAAIVILIVEKEAKAEFAKSVATDVMLAVFGREWPPKLKDVVRKTLIEPRLYRDEYELRVVIRRENIPGKASLRLELSYTIRNMTTDPVDYYISLGRLGDDMSPIIKIDKKPLEVQKKHGSYVAMLGGQKCDDYKVILDNDVTKVRVPVTSDASFKVYIKKHAIVRDEDSYAFRNEIASTGITVIFPKKTRNEFEVSLFASIADKPVRRTSSNFDEPQWEVGPMLDGHTILITWRPKDNP